MPSAPGLPALGGILEAALYAEDLEAAAAFYGELLGLPEVARVAGRHVFYRVGQTILLIFDPRATARGSANPRLPVPAHGAFGAGHLCFAASGAQIARWRARLEGAGHPIEADFVWPNGARSIYFRDPAGNSIEIAEPRLWSGAPGLPAAPGADETVEGSAQTAARAGGAPPRRR